MTKKVFKTSTEAKIIKVAKITEPIKIAGTARKFLSQYGACELHCVGQSANMVATKALALLTARYKLSYTASVDYLYFTDNSGEEQQGIKYSVKR